MGSQILATTDKRILSATVVSPPCRSNAANLQTDPGKVKP